MFECGLQWVIPTLEWHTQPSVARKIRPRSYKSLLLAKLPKHEIVFQWLQGLPSPAQRDTALPVQAADLHLLPPARPGSGTYPSGRIPIATPGSLLPTGIAALPSALPS